MKATRTILALLGAAIALPLAGVAHAEGSSNDQAIDDIVVVGKKSQSELRREVFESEEDFYALYNELNDDDEYDVKCFYETPTGTRIKNHVCRAKFISDSYKAHANRNQGDATRISQQDNNPALAEKTKKFQEKLESLIATNPELQARLARYNTARARFFEERDKNHSN